MVFFKDLFGTFQMPRKKTKILEREVIANTQTSDLASINIKLCSVQFSCMGGNGCVRVYVCREIKPFIGKLS